MSARIAAAGFVHGLCGLDTIGKAATISGCIRQAQSSNIGLWIQPLTNGLPNQSNQCHRNFDERDP
jgi:hypothetical protein